MVAAPCRDRRRQHRPQRLGGKALDARRRMRGEPGEQLVHLADRALQRCDHVGAEFGVVCVTLGIAGEQRQLADQVLHVVQDEGEAAVELLEPAGVGKRFLAEHFGERARRLAAGGAQEVEVLPVERPAIFGRGDEYEADQALVMDQGHARPGLVSSASHSGTGTAGRASPEHPAAIGIEVEDAAGLLDRDQNRRASSGSYAGACRPASSTPRRRSARRRCREPAATRRAPRECRRRP